MEDNKTLGKSVTKRIIPKEERKTKPYKYLEILTLPVSKKGKQGVVIEYDFDMYTKICMSVIPRYNKKFTPKHFMFFVSEDGKTINVYRDK